MNIPGVRHFESKNEISKHILKANKSTTTHTYTHIQRTHTFYWLKNWPLQTELMLRCGQTLHLPLIRTTSMLWNALLNCNSLWGVPKGLCLLNEACHLEEGCQERPTDNHVAYCVKTGWTKQCSSRTPSGVNVMLVSPAYSTPSLCK